VSDDDFTQSHQVPELVLECIQRACQRYRKPELDADFERFRLCLTPSSRIA
jgi:hypothetical protein